jgi:hypothetical protein
LSRSISDARRTVGFARHAIECMTRAWAAGDIARDWWADRAGHAIECMTRAWAAGDIAMDAVALASSCTRSHRAEEVVAGGVR